MFKEAYEDGVNMMGVDDTVGFLESEVGKAPGQFEWVKGRATRLILEVLVILKMNTFYLLQC